LLVFRAEIRRQVCGKENCACTTKWFLYVSKTPTVTAAMNLFQQNKYYERGKTLPGRSKVSLPVTKPYRLQMRTVLGSLVPSNLASTVLTPEKKNHLEGYILILKLIFKGRVCGCGLNSPGYETVAWHIFRKRINRAPISVTTTWLNGIS